MNPNKPKFSNKKIVAENKFLRAIQRDFVDSKNRKGNIITLESVRGKNGTFILAITKNNQVILNRDYKFGPDDFIYNLPSGFIEIGISSKENILKELKEESGFKTDDEPIYLGKTMQNGYINGYNDLYFVKNCYNIGSQDTHEGEEIENFLVDINDFEKMIGNYEILDPYSEICYFRAKNLKLI